MSRQITNHVIGFLAALFCIATGVFPEPKYWMPCAAVGAFFHLILVERANAR